jgi:dinuclear metal center YbgI/SA1388 family protein
MTSLAELISEFERRWPLQTAESWDQPGLMLGKRSAEISKVLLSVDFTSEVLTEAVEVGAELVFCHHPPFLKGVNELSEEGFKGNLVAEANRRSIAVYAAHTNADGAQDGVTDSLAKVLGLRDAIPFDSFSNLGRVGNLRESVTLLEFAREIAKKLPATASGIRVAGPAESLVSRVAILGGAGDSYLSAARALDVDVYVTSDLRHHPAQDFIEQSKIEGWRPALIDISHWAAEWIWLDGLANSLSKKFPEVGFTVSELRTDPWDFAVMQ